MDVVSFDSRYACSAQSSGNVETGFAETDEADPRMFLHATSVRVGAGSGRLERFAQTRVLTGEEPHTVLDTMQSAPGAGLPGVRW